MKTKSIFFPLLMLLLTFLTFAKYREIKYFQNNSQEYTFVVYANQSDISDLKENLQNFTYQSVLDEQISDGNYKITVKCPPDKIKFINKIIDKLLSSEDK
jgi:hypothetical protein